MVRHAIKKKKKRERESNQQDTVGGFVFLSPSFQKKKGGIGHSGVTRTLTLKIGRLGGSMRVSSPSSLMVLK